MDESISNSLQLIFIILQPVWEGIFLLLADKRLMEQYAQEPYQRHTEAVGLMAYLLIFMSHLI